MNRHPPTRLGGRVRAITGREQVQQTERALLRFTPGAGERAMKREVSLSVLTLSKLLMYFDS